MLHKMSESDPIEKTIISLLKNGVRWNGSYTFYGHQFPFDVEWSEAFFEKYFEFIPNSFMMKNELSEAFIEKHIEDFGIDKVLTDCKLSSSFLEKLILKQDWKKSDQKWGFISDCQELDDWFMEKYMSELNWNDIVSLHMLSPEFIRKHVDFLQKYDFSYYQTLSEDLIIELSDKVDWEGIFQEQKLSEEFREKYAHLNPENK